MNSPRFWMLQLTGAALLVVMALSGSVVPVFIDDATYMTHGIAAVLPIGILLAAFGKWTGTARCGRIMIALGLLGTVIGFRIALSGVSPDTAGDISAVRPMVASLISGMGTALSTTIIGLIGSIWLRLTAWLTGPA